MAIKSTDQITIVDLTDAYSVILTNEAHTFLGDTDSVNGTQTATVGVEVTGAALTALGTIKWYKDGSTTASGTGATLSISSGDVTTKASYTAQLEA